MHRFRLVLLGALLIHTMNLRAQDTIPGMAPLWELGLGGGTVVAPDYPGSDHTNFWMIPFPFGVYRGEILHSDRRGGTRARLFHSASYEFNVSAGGGLPSSSHANGVREGMPDLQWIGELGPRLMIDLWEQEPGGRTLRLGVPVRLAVSTDWRAFKDRGLNFAPELMYDNPHVLGSDWDAFVHLTVSFLDRRFNDYFYGVNPQYATAERREYKARAGYLQTDLSAGLMIPFKQSRLRLFTFASVQDLHGSANEASPLFRSPLNTSVSVVAMWLFARSEIQVQSDD